MADAPTPIAEIDHGPSKFEQFMDKHQKTLIAGAVLIALGVVGYVIWSGVEEGKQHEAGSALVKADEIAEYQDVIKNHSGTNAAATAMPLLADMQWADSQPDALQTLEEFISGHPEHPAALTAKVSLGLRLLEQGKTDEAREALKEVAESHGESYMAPLANIALGDMAKKAGELAEAKAFYEKAKGEGTRDNAFAGLADERLAIVNAKPPVKIKPAPPAPPETPEKNPEQAAEEAKKTDGAAPAAPATPAGATTPATPENSGPSDKKDAPKPPTPAAPAETPQNP